ncbi:MAG: dTDP-glucose 4,6-dehydratase [Puniceicoccales bacterium]|jgi:dTDP-glucose 4,6-dehydratase|nr:dTDP-glucose 4,6-dehydratase [Puniceicoccales bacterium]
MKILLTGGAGFIGSHFVKQAIQSGHEIVNVDKLTYAGNLDNLEEYAQVSQHHFHKEDIINRENMRVIFEKEQPAVVVHMAAESHVDRSIESGDAFLQTNVIGTYHLLTVVHHYWQSLPKEKRLSFRFVHLSTDEVFGTLQPNEDKFCETTPYRPNSPYAASKASSDLFVRAYHHTYGLPIIIVNTTNNYGPFQFPEKLIPVVILNALEQKSIPLYGDGKQVRDWLFVEDHVEALLKLLTYGRIGETYCIGGENEWTNLDVVNEICALLDRIKPLAQGSYKDLITFVQDRPGHDRRYAINADKIHQELGWFARHSMQEGLQKTVQWYVTNAEKLNTLFDRHRLGLKNNHEKHF